MRWLLKYAAFLPIAPLITGAHAWTPERYSGRTVVSSLSYSDAASPSAADDESSPIAQPVTPFDAAFDPPAVQNAQARHAIEGRFHPAGARGFERAQRRIEPDVRAGHQFQGEAHAVIRQERDRDHVRQLATVAGQRLDQLLAGLDRADGPCRQSQPEMETRARCVSAAPDRRTADPAACTLSCGGRRPGSEPRASTRCR